MNIVKKLVRKMLDVSGLRGLNVLRNSEYLKTCGWFNSVKQKQAVDADGKEIPWMSYPVTEFLKQRLNKGMAVFEYGSGNSSLWLAKQVNTVISCEHDKAWYELVRMKTPSNIKIIYRNLDSGEYTGEISNYRDEFDIIIFDGRDRVNCIKKSLGALKNGGVIILDDSFREEYKAGKDFLYANGFKSIAIAGPTPIYFNRGETAIFYRNNNCFNI